ncbi:hypothetical protein ACT3CE_00255 [Marinifilum sp. RC60d5]|uniref:hypothetical protein n=1 Tax=Marinifilum sp. RC60d5 TaxID=3458414 RepID=UPI004035009E
MPRYYVNRNAQANGDHEVHKEGCDWMPSSKIDLRIFSNCESAVAAAENYYSTADGCEHCCKACHNS